MMRAALPLLALLLGAATANAEVAIETCRDLKDDATRLKCYDLFAETTPAPKKPAAPAAVSATANARSNYAKQIERAFLSDGVDISMMSIEVSGSTYRVDPKHVPQLVFFGYFGRPFVYKAVAESPLLEVARKHGFRSVDFFSKADGHWTYELPATGPLPRCDRMNRLCQH